MIIRKANDSDLEEVKRIIAILFPSSPMKILKKDEFFVAEIDGKIVGFCHFRIKKNICYIAGLGVLPSYQKQGIGSALLATTLIYLDEKNLDETYLKVRPTNHATTLYSRFGFYQKKIGQTLTLVRKRPS